MYILVHIIAATVKSSKYTHITHIACVIYMVSEVSCTHISINSCSLRQLRYQAHIALLLHSTHEVVLQDHRFESKNRHIHVIVLLHDHQASSTSSGSVPDSLD